MGWMRVMRMAGGDGGGMVNRGCCGCAQDGAGFGE